MTVECEGAAQCQGHGLDLSKRSCECRFLCEISQLCVNNKEQVTQLRDTNSSFPCAEQSTVTAHRTPLRTSRWPLTSGRPVILEAAHRHAVGPRSTAAPPVAQVEDAAGHTHISLSPRAVHCEMHLNVPPRKSAASYKCKTGDFKLASQFWIKMRLF